MITHRYIVDLAYKEDERHTVTVRGVLAPNGEQAQQLAKGTMQHPSMWRVVGVDREVS